MRDFLALTGIGDASIHAALAGLALSTARLGAVFYVFPPFARLGVDGALIRGGVVAALSVPVYPSAVASARVLLDASAFGFAVVIAKELFVGLTIGLAFGAPFWAASTAGDLVEFQRGALASDIVDPGSGEPETALGTFLVLALSAAFMTVGVFTAFLATVYETYAIWPLDQPLPDFGPGQAEAAAAVLGAVFGIGLLIAAPLLFLMLLIELGLAVAGRFAPQLNVFFVAMAVKTAAVFLVLPIYLIIVAEQFGSRLGAMSAGLDFVRGLL